MGSVVAAQCRAQTRLWVDAGRSEATAERAATAGLVAVSSLDELAQQADMIVSVCPPSAAGDVAERLADAEFAGIFVDANAIAPDGARAIGHRFERFVDASIVGLPPTSPGSTRLYLSGPAHLTTQVQELWAGSLFETRPIGESIGAASALKMAYAGWTKGSTALLFTMAALAEEEDVSEALRAEWERSIPELLPRLERGAKGAATKAWRFTGEMQQIASTLAAADLPDGFHLGAEEIYERLAVFKNAEPTVAEVLSQLLAPDQ